MLIKDYNVKEEDYLPHCNPSLNLVFRWSKNF